MSLDQKPSNDAPLTSPEALCAFFRAAERPAKTHQVGLEHEKLVFPGEGDRAVAYDGLRGIGALLKGLERFGHQPVRDAAGGPTIALSREQATISLEPGGQLELSGSPFPTVTEAHQENLRHLEEVKAVCGELGLRLVALGYRPFDRVSEMPLMPKARYQVMRQSLPARGRLALEMMFMTATGQMSFDWSDEEDCGRKLTLLARATPLLVALCANSPLKEGRPAGVLSYRSRTWEEVDPMRCGYFPKMLDGTFRYRDYVDWALAAPMLFLRREGKYLAPSMTFGELLAHGFEGEPAQHSDWVDHLSTLYPEVRVKRVLEVRGADCVGPLLTSGLAALLRGILYDRQAREEAWQLLPALQFDEHLAFHRAGREQGLRAAHRGRQLSAWVEELARISNAGLRRLGDGDEALLAPVFEQCEEGGSPAERVLSLHQQGLSPSDLLTQVAL